MLQLPALRRVPAHSQSGLPGAPCWPVPLQLQHREARPELVFFLLDRRGRAWEQVVELERVVLQVVVLDLEIDHAGASVVGDPRVAGIER
jgi:predicted component of type VI protein secretion system